MRINIRSVAVGVIALLTGASMLVVSGSSAAAATPRSTIPQPVSGTSCPATPPNANGATASNICKGFELDLVNRINAERSARGLAPLFNDGFNASVVQQDAEGNAVSTESSTIGSYYGPGPSSLYPCGAGSAGPEQCAQDVIYVTSSNGNPASSPYPGNGTAGANYPGDGSDGVMQQIMDAPSMRDVVLGAGYTTLGVGVSCGDVPGGPGQLPPLPVDEVYVSIVVGYNIGNYGSAAAESTYSAVTAANQAQLNAAGGTLPATPNPVGLGTGIPWYCPQQKIDAAGDLSQTGGAYRYSSSPTGLSIITPSFSGSTTQGYANATFQATGGFAPYSWTMISGHLPPGIVLEPNTGTSYAPGTLAGQFLAAGNYTFTLEASDSLGDTGYQQVTINVNDPQTPGTSPVVSMAATPDGKGYWLVNNRGCVTGYGDALNYGSMCYQQLNQPIAHIVSTPDGKGYWLVANDGGIFSFGDAGFHGSMGGKQLNAPVVSMAPTKDGGGYWLVASDGGIFAFGDAGYHGSMGGHPLNKPVVGIAADYATGGYWEVATDGGIFTFDAPFRGSTGSLTLNKPINGMTVAANDNGYRLVASDGGIFSFGAPFYGSLGSKTLSAPIVGMAADPVTGGYWMVGSDGGVFSFNAPFYGAA